MKTVHILSYICVYSNWLLRAGQLPISTNTKIKCICVLDTLSELSSSIWSLLRWFVCDVKCVCALFTVLPSWSCKLNYYERMSKWCHHLLQQRLIPRRTSALIDLSLWFTFEKTWQPKILLKFAWLYCWKSQI